MLTFSESAVHQPSNWLFKHSQYTTGIEKYTADLGIVGTVGKYAAYLDAVTLF